MEGSTQSMPSWSDLSSGFFAIRADKKTPFLPSYAFEILIKLDASAAASEVTVSGYNDDDDKDNNKPDNKAAVNRLRRQSEASRCENNNIHAVILIAVVKDGDGGAHGAWRRQMVSEK
jgi:hypothetical protein